MLINIKQLFKVPTIVIVQSPSCVLLFAIPWTAACQASLFFRISWSYFKLLSIVSVIISNHLISCHSLLLLSIFPSIMVFSNESAFHTRWPKYWNSSLNISASNDIQGWFPLGLTSLTSLQFKGLSKVFSNPTIWKHQFFSRQPSLWPNSHICIWLQEKL